MSSSQLSYRQPTHCERANLYHLFSSADMNARLMHRTLGRSDFLRQLQKILGLFVTGLYLEPSELLSFFLGQERNQTFKLDRRLAGLVSPFEHQMFKFPDCLIVIHGSLS